MAALFSTTELKPTWFPIYIPFNFRKILTITEDFLPKVSHRIIIHDDVTDKYVYYYYQARKQSNWKTYYRVYGDGTLLYEGARLTYLSSLPIAEVWRAKYPYTFFFPGGQERFIPLWTDEEGLLNYIYWDNRGIWLPTAIYGETLPSYWPSIVRVTKNIPDREYYETDTVDIISGYEDNYFVKRNAKEIELCVEGYCGKLAKPVAQIAVGNETIDETWTATRTWNPVPPPGYYTWYYVLTSRTYGTTPSHTLYIGETSQTDLKLLVNIDSNIKFLERKLNELRK